MSIWKMVATIFIVPGRAFNVMKTIYNMASNHFSYVRMEFIKHLEPNSRYH